MVIFLIGLFALTTQLTAQEQEKKEETKETTTGGEFDASTFITGHVADSHEWHLLNKKNGEAVAVYLPVILYDKVSGLHVFSSRHIAEGETYEGFGIAHEGKYEGKIVRMTEAGQIDEENLPLDFSITKAVFGLMVAAAIMLWLLLTFARSYKKSGISAPKGLQGLLEPVVLFIRDDVAIPNIGEKKYMRFMPYLLTVFFFILINNLLGLIPIFPFGANVTGNISVTFVLACFTFLITQFSANKTHWRHVFAAPGVPFWLLPIMIPIELVGLISKPFALMIRLFANITAGHIIVLSLVCLIFIFKSVWVAPVSIGFVLFMDCIELLVAFLQAYVFTLLSALFIGMATQEAEHH